MSIMPEVLSLGLQQLHDIFWIWRGFSPSCSSGKVACFDAGLRPDRGPQRVIYGNHDESY